MLAGLYVSSCAAVYSEVAQLSVAEKAVPPQQSRVSVRSSEVIVL